MEGISRRQLLAGGGAGIAGVGAFAYADPLGIRTRDGGESGPSTASTPGSETAVRSPTATPDGTTVPATATSASRPRPGDLPGYARWFGTGICGAGSGSDGRSGWESVVGFDRERFGVVRDALPERVARSWAETEWLPTEPYRSAIDPADSVHGRVGLAASGTVDADLLRSENFDDAVERAILSRQLYESDYEAAVERVGDHRGLAVYHRQIPVGEGIHKGIAVSGDRYVHTRLHESRAAALDSVRAIVDDRAGETNGDGETSADGEAAATLARLLSALDPGVTATVHVGGSRRGSGATLAVDGDTAVHRQVTVYDEPLDPDCVDEEFVPLERELSNAESRPFEPSEVAVSVDGRTLLAAVEFPAAEVEPHHLDGVLKAPQYLRRRC
ncbi:hypothetical protein [Halosimplex halobium]|uniref:hypothetical protein n=1 Tax=Halosimplex halobium TaxID=3396618 RepID=UPI003F56953A